MKTVFVDTFDKKNYSLSYKEGEDYVMNVATVYDYHNDKPYISITGNHKLVDIKKIIYTIEQQQKDIAYFGVLLTQLNSKK
jgi:hypothetical protein